MYKASLAEVDPPTTNNIPDLGGLFRQKSFVAGEWRDADQGETLKVFNPADGSRIGSVAALGNAETRRAITAATKAISSWRKLPPPERGDILHRWYELIIENRESLARLMTTEQSIEEFTE